MLKISIPDNYKKGFTHLIKLGSEKRNSLFAALNEVEIGLRPHEIVAQNAQKLEIEEDALTEIIRTLFSLLSAKNETPIELSSLVKGIVEASKSLKDVELVDPDVFEQQLLQFLQAPSALSLTNKAIDLVTEREKVLITTRLITDTRPIFGDGDGFRFEATLILHNLKVQFKDNNRVKEVYFALDSKDLANLKEQIIRAEEKEKTLKLLLEEKQIKLIDFKN